MDHRDDTLKSLARLAFLATCPECSTLPLAPPEKAELISRLTAVLNSDSEVVSQLDRNNVSGRGVELFHNLYNNKETYMNFATGSSIAGPRQEKYEIEKCLGSGLTSAVFMVRNLATKGKFAIKAVDTIKWKTYEKHIYREIATVQLVRHPQIALTYEVFPLSQSCVSADAPL